MIDESGLETFTARGQKRYKCPGCGYDSYAVVEVAKHWKKSHMAEQQANENSGGSSVLFDANEEPIKGKIDVPDALKAFF